MLNEVKLEFKSRLENVVFARSVLVGFLLNINVDINVINELKTVISEGVTNSIIHGYEEDEEGVVFLNISYDDKNIFIEIIDKGIGIENIEAAKEPLFSTKENLERAGLGFTLMEVFTDEMEVLSSVNVGTKLYFRKQYNFE